MPGDWRKATDEEILRFMLRQYAPVVTSTEVAEEFDMEQQSGYRRLQSLQDDGLVDAFKPGARSKVWWVTDKGRKAINEKKKE